MAGNAGHFSFAAIVGSAGVAAGRVLVTAVHSSARRLAAVAAASAAAHTHAHADTNPDALHHRTRRWSLRPDGSARLRDVRIGRRLDALGLISVLFGLRIIALLDNRRQNDRNWRARTGRRQR